MYDYSVSSMSSTSCCEDADVLACMRHIDIQCSHFISQYIGVSTGADLIKMLIGGIGSGYLMKLAAFEGGRFILGASISGGILAVDGLLDASITLNNVLKMKDAANEAKGVFCKCK